jgi:hypothetical protein
MNQPYIQLNRRQWCELHNALCDAEQKASYLFDVLRDGGKALEAIQSIRDALKPAYEQDDAQFNAQHDYFSKIKEENNFLAIWSMYDEVPVGGFDTIHPFADAEYVLYGEHWGEEGPSQIRIRGPRWFDLYEAADQAIRASSDGHHVFIERFTPDASIPGCLHLQTGS